MNDNLCMPLIDCPDCSNEISDSAISCPSCGFSLLKQQMVRMSKELASSVMDLVMILVTFGATLLRYAFRLITLPVYFSLYLFKTYAGLFADKSERK